MTKLFFVRQVTPGASERSFGIQVARLAGLPEGVVNRAKEILGSLENGGEQVQDSKDSSTDVSDANKLKRSKKCWKRKIKKKHFHCQEKRGSFAVGIILIMVPNLYHEEKGDPDAPSRLFFFTVCWVRPEIGVLFPRCLPESTIPFVLIFQITASHIIGAN